MANTLRQVIQGSGTVGSGVSEEDIDFTLDGGLSLSDASKAIAWVNFTTGGDNSNHHTRAYCYYFLDNSTLRLDLKDSSSGFNLSSNYSYAIIEFDSDSDIQVQHDVMTFDQSAATASLPATISKNINPVALDNSMIIKAGHKHENGTDNTTGAEESYRHELEDYNTWSVSVDIFMNSSADETHRAQIVDWGSDASAQQGTITYFPGDTYKTFSPPTSVDPTRSLLFVSESHTPTLSLDHIYKGYAASLNTDGDIEIFRWNPGTDTHTIYWQIIEFPSSFISVQHQLHETTELETNDFADIDIVDTDRSVVLGTSSQYWGWGWGASSSDIASRHYGYTNGYYLLDYPSRVEIQTTGTTQAMGFQVVEFLAEALDPLVTTKYFVASSGGSDANDGADLLGINLTSASWTFSTKRITQSGNFSSYSFAPGDQIFLSHASITDGLYTIASKVSSNTIELESSINGSDLTDVRSSTGPFNTIKTADTAVAAAGEVFLATMNVGEVFDQDTWPLSLTAQGDSTSGLIKFSGTNAQGIIDGTIAVVDASGQGSVACISIDSAVPSRLFFQYISAENGTLEGWDVNTSQVITFYRCESRNNIGDGWDWNAAFVNSIECVAFGNGVHGFHSASQDNFHIGSFASNNDNEGFEGQSGNRMDFIFCAAVSSVGPGQNQDSGFSTGHMIANCISDGNNNAGYDNAGSSESPILINNIFTNNVNSGVDANSGPMTLIANAFYQATPVADDAIVIESNRITLDSAPYSNLNDDDFTLVRNRDGAKCMNSFPHVWIKMPKGIEGFDGTFTTDRGWTLGASWTIDNGVATTSGSDTPLTVDNPPPLVVGVTYETVFTVVSISSSDILMILGNSSGTSRTSPGTYREFITCGGITGDITLDPGTSNTVVIDDFFIAPANSGPGRGGRMTSFRPVGVSNPDNRRWAHIG